MYKNTYKIVAEADRRDSVNKRERDLVRDV